MRGRTQYPVNDIGQCVEQAHSLAQRLQEKRHRDLSICRVFTSLAGDETIGFLAYAIWRGRSELLSMIQTTTARRKAGADRSGVSRAPSYWQGERVAFGDLPARRHLTR
jgi:hypothetical protein